MKKNQDLLNLRLIVQIILILSWYVQLCIGQQSKDNFIESRTRLTQQIDSLDIEKQLKKRLGENISDIEERQSVLQDSLKILRTTFQNDLASSSNQTTLHKRLSINTIKSYIPEIFNIAISKLNPRSTFDWFILITSAVAFISISILFVVIVASFKRKRRTKNVPQQTPSKKLSTQNKYTPVDNRSARENQAITLLDDLKKKIQIDKIDNEPQNLRTTIREPKKVPYESTPPAAANDLESLVLQAYRNGSDIAEISKKFHISSDHVSLIIKVKTT